MTPSENSFISGADGSWQEEAALLLLRSGFRPASAVGQVEHIDSHHGGRTGRTFGSVWRAMRTLVSREQDGCAGKGQDIDCDPD